MAIEIKELRIKVTVVENNEATPFTEKIGPVKWQELKASMVNECISKVLEKIKEKSER
ncbi:hypothetical protein FIA58_015510 [Flavobacterium jejuense]|uniref:Phage protein n=1 Tax=Flavobacterium jejuense TaxID=1544455 RepID=A0ABX0IZE6_9FLAO|nr:DUF5908 family protein [Flavobacterium jejuense]NHN27090.1 hypothetical protein [Flavobacterium jejuense]